MTLNVQMLNILFTAGEFLGRFHPVLVHLPIGILLLGAIFQLLSQKQKYQQLHSAVGLSLFIGMLTAIAACISGFLLSQSGEYDAALVSKHQWFGIGVAVVSIASYWLNKKKFKQQKWLMVLLVILITITGHLGGSITHGEDYLTQALLSTADGKEASIKPIANVQQAVVYADIIQPILQTKCFSCHGPAKQKGRLRLDDPSFIMQGGKDGKVIIAGKAGESNLIERILLPADNEDHMPPKEKGQLSKDQIDLLHWWVSSGANFTNKVSETQQPEKIKPILAALQSGEKKQAVQLSFIPEAPVEQAADSILQKLKRRGVAILPVAQNSNYLSANFIAVDSITKQDLQLLTQLNKQLVWLKFGGTRINDEGLKTVSQLPALTRLWLEQTGVTGKGIGQLKRLTRLQYLNLSGTHLSLAEVAQLKSLPALKQLYVYQTSIAPNEYMTLQKLFSKTVIDTGGYKVPTIQSDTTLLTKPE